MSKANEPAFPIVGYDQSTRTLEISSEGISIRTYLAGQAMMGMLANPEFTLPAGTSLAKAAVLEADELIAELNKTDK